MTTRTRSRKAPSPSRKAAARKAAAKPAAEESVLLRWLKDRHITEVECLVPDITGNADRKSVV